jgi:microcystin-dependent protein
MSAAAAGGSGSGTCRVFPHGNGNGSSTFNVPDRRGRVVAGRDTMGNTNAGRLDAYFGDYLGSWGGQENVTLTTGYMPSHAHPGSTFSGTAATAGSHQHQYVVRSELLTVDADDGGGAITSVWRNDNTALATASGDHTHTVSGTVTVAAQGSATPTPTIQPTGVSNYIIKY